MMAERQGDRLRALILVAQEASERTHRVSIDVMF